MPVVQRLEGAQILGTVAVLGRKSEFVTVASELHFPEVPALGSANAHGFGNLGTALAEVLRGIGAQDVSTLGRDPDQVVRSLLQDAGQAQGLGRGLGCRERQGDRIQSDGDSSVDQVGDGSGCEVHSIWLSLESEGLVPLP